MFPRIVLRISEFERKLCDDLSRTCIGHDPLTELLYVLRKYSFYFLILVRH